MLRSVLALAASLALAGCSGAPPVCPAPVSATPQPGRDLAALAAIAGGGGAPCFPRARVLFAENVRGELDEVSPYNGEQAGPPMMYGSCRVAAGIITDANGLQIAAIHCGIDVVAPGFTDNLLNEVGASGQRVIDGQPDAAHRLQCVDLGDRVRCDFAGPTATADAELPRAYYFVSGPARAEVIRGREAIAFFAARTVTSFQMRGYCH